MKLGKDGGERQPMVGCAYATIALALVAAVAIANAIWSGILWLAGL